MEHEEELKMSGKFERKAKIEKLELNRETVQDLTEDEADAVEGGNVNQSRRFGCTGRCKPSKTACPTNVNECVYA
jgi:hypothetical protein